MVENFLAQQGYSKRSMVYKEAEEVGLCYDCLALVGEVVLDLLAPMQSVKPAFVPSSKRNINPSSYKMNYVIQVHCSIIQ